MPLTEYGPWWNISIGFAQWQEPEKVDAIRNWLIANESRIIEQFPLLNDGGTGLGYESVTSRSGMYNLFDFADECPELNDLLKFFRLSYIKFIAEDKTEHKELDIVCWFNVVKDTQQIKEHAHCSEPDSYLSGNMHFDNYPTHTYYRTPFNPFERVPYQNIKGGFTMFPSYVPHKTDVFNSDNDGVRISVAFDLHLADQPTDLYVRRPFMNRDIFNEVIKDLEDN